MRTYPNIFSQRDSSWANEELGTTPGATISAYGCLLTCFAMKACYYGHDFTPLQLDSQFVSEGIFIQGDMLPDNALRQVLPEAVYRQSFNFQNVPADLSLLKQLSEDDYITVTLEVDFDHDPTDGIQTHFVELHSYDGQSLKIYDPWYGSDDDFTTHYGPNPAQTILKFVVYKGTPVLPLPEVEVMPTPPSAKPAPTTTVNASPADSTITLPPVSETVPATSYNAPETAPESQVDQAPVFQFAPRVTQLFRWFLSLLGLCKN